MSRQLEGDLEERYSRRIRAGGQALDGGLNKALEYAGAELTGLAFKLRPGECLLVIKVILAGRCQVAFVGGEDVIGCVLKAQRDAGQDKLRWRPDKYVGESSGDKSRK